MFSLFILELNVACVYNFPIHVTLMTIFTFFDLNTLLGEKHAVATFIEALLQAGRSQILFSIPYDLIIGLNLPAAL
jgi:hypothetical protein